MWWCNDDVSNSVSEKQKLWKEWKQGNTSKEKYLDAKIKARNVYQATCQAERKRFGNIFKEAIRNMMCLRLKVNSPN